MCPVMNLYQMQITGYQTFPCALITSLTPNWFHTLNELYHNTAMSSVDPDKRNHLNRSLSAVEDGLTKETNFPRSASANIHCNIWSKFCTNMALDPLLLSLSDQIPILNTFDVDYYIGTICKKFCNCIVKNSSRSVSQYLTAIKSKYPQLSRKVTLDIRLMLHSGPTPRKNHPPTGWNIYPSSFSTT